jgi:gamma-glutamyl hydrolase
LGNSYYFSEWNPTEAINHSFDAVSAMQYFAQFFVNEARKSNHKYPNAEEEYKALIYNYNAEYSEDIVSDFEQIYVF